MEYDKDRDCEDLGPYYIRHVKAMTAESLFEKSDIAAELAWRDRQIEQLQARVAELTTGRDALRADAEKWHGLVREWCDVAAYAERETLMAAIKAIYDKSRFALAARGAG